MCTIPLKRENFVESSELFICLMCTFCESQRAEEGNYLFYLFHFPFSGGPGLGRYYVNSADGDERRSAVGGEERTMSGNRMCKQNEGSRLISERERRNVRPREHDTKKSGTRIKCLFAFISRSAAAPTVNESSRPSLGDNGFAD